jgi:hypothetical protein
MDINLVQGTLNELFFINNNINQSGNGGLDLVASEYQQQDRR